DEVIVPEPCFVAYQPTVVFAGGTPVAVPTYVAQSFQVTVDDLERARTPRTKAVLLGYPNNPTGAVLERARLAEIAEWAGANDLLIISDEIYDRLVYGIEHTCFSSLAGMRDRSILLGGFSKAYAMTGWRLLRLPVHRGDRPERRRVLRAPAHGGEGRRGPRLSLRQIGRGARPRFLCHLPPEHRGGAQQDRAVPFEAALVF